MKQFLLTMGAMLACVACFAATQPSGFAKGSSQLEALGSAFRGAPSLSLQKHTNDIIMVYGGKDISPSIKPTATHA